MNRQTAAFLKWAGILLIIGNVMAWEGVLMSEMFLVVIMCPASGRFYDKDALRTCTRTGLTVCGVLGIFAGMFLSRRWRARQGEGQARNLLEQYPGEDATAVNISKSYSSTSTGCIAVVSVPVTFSYQRQGPFVGCLQTPPARSKR